MRLTLKEKKAEAGDAVTFIFNSEEPTVWEAGQYIKYTLVHHKPDEKGVKRYFTISAAPDEQFPRITTRLNSEKLSSFKQALSELPIGGKIDAEPPRGSFIVTNPHQPIIFIAGGIGITPFRSILLDMEYRQQPINLPLLYANRGPEIIFQDELEQVASRNPGLDIHYIIEPERINENKIKKVINNYTQPLYYISGPEPMVQATFEMLRSLKIPEEQLKRDDFPGYDWP